MKLDKNFTDFFFKALKESPVLLMTPQNVNYREYVTFFEGYFLGIKMFTGVDLERQISNWFQYRTQTKAPNMNWFAQFEWINENENEEEKTSKLVSTIELFFRENYA